MGLGIFEIRVNVCSAHGSNATQNLCHVRLAGGWKFGDLQTNVFAQAAQALFSLESFASQKWVKKLNPLQPKKWERRGCCN
jgi:hypothetical protein